MPKTSCNFVPPNRSFTLMKLQYYKLEQRDNIDMKKTRTVYKLRSTGLLSGEDFIGMVAHNKNYSETVVEGVLKDVAHELALMLGNGNNVVVPGIGAFSLGIRLEERQPLSSEHVGLQACLQFAGHRAGKEGIYLQRPLYQR